MSLALEFGWAPVAVAAGPAAASTSSGSTWQRTLEMALDHYRARRFAEARAAFEQVLSRVPQGEDRDNLEFDIAACDYELGRFRAAEERFARLAEGPAASAAASRQALLHAGWAALGAEDVGAAERYLARTAASSEPDAERDRLAEAIDRQRQELDARAFDAALAKATAAYDSGDLAGAEAAATSAREHSAHATPRSRAALDYLTGLLARERGDDATSRAALERSLSENPDDGAALAMLGDLDRASGDTESAARRYRASLAAELSTGEADVVRDALAALYHVPRTGFGAWAVLGAGYDSNATQSGLSEAVGYALPGARGSPFAAPAWGVEYRFEAGQTARIVPYYAGDWLVLSDASVEDVSLQSHEAGARWHWAPTPSLELRLAAGGGISLSGLELEPFSLDGALRARVALQHGPSFQSALLAEARPSLGLSGRDYLTGTRGDVVLRERFELEAWGASVEVGYRYNAIGTQQVAVDPARYPSCNLACVGARYVIPLGYAGPSAGAAVDLVLARLELGAGARYEHRTYLADSRIDGPMPFGFGRELSEKTRVDDRYILNARAHYRFASSPELGVYLDYALRISRSNVAFRRGDPEHAFDYDDRNFSQHIVELGVDFRY